ncbi:hypothetical protein I6J39_16730 [Streptomyces californicus]|uniref:Uncharacterized protein n=1 Tax=Streptomyces californicus TaxID=67351 RepID=A0ABX7J248_9ACTN|nr:MULTISPECIES: hypothetical protein [Streptomyces]QRV28772.1 hypothetical protein I6J39_16730 [Streptomyces californicus]QRV42186.1 hypothetical protein I6J41_16645 [Streptomyces californicus]
MNVFEWIVIGLVLTWAVVTLAAGVVARIAYSLGRHDDSEFTVGLDRLRAAIATADIETEPGGPSADLIDCWGIWPDAPIHTGEDDLR